MSDKTSITPANHLAGLPSLTYLLECSLQSLQALELAALSRVSDHLKTAKLEWEEAASHKEIAGVARLLIEHREELLAVASRTIEVRSAPVFPGDNSLTLTGPKLAPDSLIGPAVDSPSRESRKLSTEKAVKRPKKRFTSRGRN